MLAVAGWGRHLDSGLRAVAGYNGSRCLDYGRRYLDGWLLLAVSAAGWCLDLHLLTAIAAASRRLDLNLLTAIAAASWRLDLHLLLLLAVSAVYYWRALGNGRGND